MSSMKDILINFKKELACTYRAQKNIIDVTEKYLAQLEDAETGGSGGIDYSTDELDTGIKWIDGKTIYRKTINCGALPNTASKDVAHGITNIDRIVSIEGYAYNPTLHSTMPIPYSTNSTAANVGVNADTTSINIFDGSDRSAFTEAYITLVYTKTS